MRERTSVVVSKLDTDKLAAFLNTKYDRDDLQGEAMVVVNTPEGLATICHEGVGWFKNDDDKYLVGAYVGYNNPTFFVTEEELLSFVSDEQVDLADFINRFGDRLESNYSIWYNQVKDTPQNVRPLQYN